MLMVRAEGVHKFSKFGGAVLLSRSRIKTDIDLKQNISFYKKDIGEH